MDGQYHILHNYKQYIRGKRVHFLYINPSSQTSVSNLNRERDSSVFIVTYRNGEVHMYILLFTIHVKFPVLCVEQ